MPSQPDYTLAYALSPHLKPEGAEEFLVKEKEKTQKLAALLAEKLGQTPEEVLAALDAGVTPTEVRTETTAAQFFGSNEGTKYYPIAEIEKSKVKKENIRYFQTEQEAKDASYTAA